MKTLAAACQVVGLALALASPALAQADAGPKDFPRAWKRAADTWRTALEREHAVGASLWFVQDGKVLAAENWGVSDLETRRKVDDQTIWHWASITKTFTGVAVMQLVERGLVGLDDPITRYLPEARQIHNPFGSMDDVTVRRLLSHGGGLRARTFPWRTSGSDWQPHEPAEWSQIAAMMPYTEIEFAPGSRCSYSNLGLSMLGRMVEVVTGDPIETYLTKNVLMPLGMTRSYFDVTPWHLRPVKSNNYYWKDGKYETLGVELDTGATVANGGLNAPVGDMVKWLDFWMGSGERTNHEAVLSRAGLKRMWEPVCAIEAHDGLDQKMGLTFFSFDFPSAGSKGAMHFVGHTGGQKAFSSFVYVQPETKTAVLFADNTRDAAARGEDTAFRASRRAVLGEVAPLFRAR